MPLVFSLIISLLTLYLPRHFPEGFSMLRAVGISDGGDTLCLVEGR